MQWIGLRYHTCAPWTIVLAYIASSQPVRINRFRTELSLTQKAANLWTEGVAGSCSAMNLTAAGRKKTECQSALQHDDGRGSEPWGAWRAGRIQREIQIGDGEQRERQRCNHTPEATPGIVFSHALAVDAQRLAARMWKPTRQHHHGLVESGPKRGAEIRDPQQKKQECR